jgi:hypothetical protein
MDAIEDLELELGALKLKPRRIGSDFASSMGLSAREMDR